MPLLVTSFLIKNIGAASALAGVTRMSISLTVIMFELTGALSYVLPIMMTVLIANFVGNLIIKMGIYDGLIQLNGYPFLDIKENYNHTVPLTASSVMTKTQDLEVLSANGYSMESLEEILNSSSYQGFPVVSSLQEMRLIGYTGKAELLYALEKARSKNETSASTPVYFSEELPIASPSTFVDLRPWMESTPFTVTPKFPLIMVVELFKKMGLRYALVTKRGKLIGLITKKDLLRHISSCPGDRPEIPDVVNRATG
jgi:chloride channel 3/4/5